MVKTKLDESMYASEESHDDDAANQSFLRKSILDPLLSPDPKNKFKPKSLKKRLTVVLSDYSAKKTPR